MKPIIIIMLSIFLLSCHKDNHKTSPNNLDQLVDLMVGSFSSMKQSEDDKDYFDIRLEMIKIWPESTDGQWLYVEQAVSTHLEKPYRQRVYHVTELENSKYSSAVYELPNPEKYIGAHKDSSKLSLLDPSLLIKRQGCAVILEKIKDNVYSGSTNAKTCLSTMRGASYATSIVTIDKDKILSWDRGFDAKDTHVWGADKGAYVFDRK